MWEVAQFLAVAAVSRLDPTERDRFGRSAFNRYYYSVFLEVRAMLSAFQCGWEGHNHRGLPDLLRTNVVEAIKKQALREQKLSVRGWNSCNTAIRETQAAASDLALLLEAALRVREAADYQPETEITEDPGGKFSLLAVSTHEAQNWQRRARLGVGVIRKHARDLKLV